MTVGTYQSKKILIF